jgi:hypothetical protein
MSEAYHNFGLLTTTSSLSTQLLSKISAGEDQPVLSKEDLGFWNFSSHVTLTPTLIARKSLATLHAVHS